MSSAPEFRLETERLILRDWREEDWEPFWQGTNTPAVMEWLGGVCDEAKRADVRKRLEKYQVDNGHTFWVVERKNDGAILGFCGLKRCTDEDGPFGMPEIGWRLRKDAWGKGYAKEAATATLDLAFDRLDMGEVIAMTVNGNEPSWGLMLALGMVRRPDLDFPLTFWNTDMGPVIVHSITEEQWRTRHA